MHELTVESTLGDQLGQLGGQVVLCDSNGRALGFFSPLPHRPPVADLNLEPPLSIAETEQLRMQQRSGKPLSEILARLDVP